MLLYAEFTLLHIGAPGCFLRLSCLTSAITGLLHLSLQLFLLLLFMMTLDLILNLVFGFSSCFLRLLSGLGGSILRCIAHTVFSIFLGSDLSVICQVLDLIFGTDSCLFHAFCHLFGLVQRFDIMFYFTGLDAFPGTVSGILSHCITFLATTTSRPFL